MKFAFWILVSAILLTGCSPAHMVKKEDNFNVARVKPKEGKSALVVARTTSFGGAVNFFNYIDSKPIGVTKGKGCIVTTDIEPGQKYIIARTESLETGKIKFEPDTVYYLQESPRMGWVVARVSLHPLSQAELISEIGSDGCTLYEMDPNDPIDRLTEHEYQEAVTDYEREVKEGHHKEFESFTGTRVR